MRWQASASGAGRRPAGFAGSLTWSRASALAWLAWRMPACRAAAARGLPLLAPGFDLVLSGLDDSHVTRLVFHIPDPCLQLGILIAALLSQFFWAPGGAVSRPRRHGGGRLSRSFSASMRRLMFSPLLVEQRVALGGSLFVLAVVGVGRVTRLGAVSPQHVVVLLGLLPRGLLGVVASQQVLVLLVGGDVAVFDGLDQLGGGGGFGGGVEKRRGRVPPKPFPREACCCRTASTPAAAARLPYGSSRRFRTSGRRSFRCVGYYELATNCRKLRTAHRAQWPRRPPCGAGRSRPSACPRQTPARPGAGPAPSARPGRCSQTPAAIHFQMQPSQWSG